MRESCCDAGCGQLNELPATSHLVRHVAFLAFSLNAPRGSTLKVRSVTYEGAKLCWCYAEAYAANLFLIGMLGQFGIYSPMARIATDDIEIVSHLGMRVFDLDEC